MTFYNIIFNIFFLEACRQVLLLWDTPHMWVAATIELLVFNDTVSAKYPIFMWQRGQWAMFVYVTYALGGRNPATICRDD
jgi:hypothetical protein